MSSLAYYLVSLGALLLVIAAVSGLIARHLRRAQRQSHAVALLDALARSTDWVAAQGRAVCFQSPPQPSDPALQEIAAVQRAWFPELEAATDDLLAVHGRLAELLRLHERLRVADPEAWLDAAHDAAFMSLRREHCAIVQAMERRLIDVVEAPLGGEGRIATHRLTGSSALRARFASAAAVPLPQRTNRRRRFSVRPVCQ